jgi:Rrf2 family nitric oxide-sensitive transcriptional repressor
MIKINRTTEYGLLALLYMSRKRKDSMALPASAREIADHYSLPYEITAKTLQKLKESAWISSTHGARGGYTLKTELRDIKLAELIRLMEGETHLVECGDPRSEILCELHGRCDIRGYMNQLNRKWSEFIETQTLADLGLESEPFLSRGTPQRSPELPIEGLTV